MATATAALDSARVYLNDVGKQIWTDAILLPYLREAHKDLLLVLWLNGLPVVKEQSAALTVTAGATTVASPSGLVEPIELKERAQGSQESWAPMVEQAWTAPVRPASSLTYWTWREEVIEFIGATTNREVLIRYWKSLSEIADASSALGFILAEAFLGPQTAGYAAGSVGNTTLASELLFIASGQNIGIAGSKLDSLIRANVKGQQNLPARRIPYRRFRRFRMF